MKIGVVADAHLNPGYGRVLRFHNSYRTDEAPELYRTALARCVEGGADVLALLGDLAHLGDGETLGWALSLAAGTGLPVWAVPGNHDVSERADALLRAVHRVGAENVRVATPDGDAFGEELRVAGLSVWSEDWGFTSRTVAGPRVSAWGDDAVLLLSHYPIVSSTKRAAKAGLRYAGDLDDLDSVARPLLRRPAPTVVLSGHLHLRDTSAQGSVLQIGCGALVESPFEVVFLNVCHDHGGRMAVERDCVPVARPRHGECPPVLSRPKEVWAFEEGAWNLSCADDARQELAGDVRG